MSLNISNITTTAEQTKCIEYGEIKKSGVQCTVGAVCISYLLFTIFYNRNFDQPKQHIFIALSRFLAVNDRLSLI